MKDLNPINPNTASRLLAFRGAQVSAKVRDAGESGLTEGEVVTDVSVQYYGGLGFEVSFQTAKGKRSFYATRGKGLKEGEVALKIPGALVRPLLVLGLA